MSWRILIEPAYFGEDPKDQAGADWVIPLNATEEDVEEVARKAAWSLPLKIFTPSYSDPRYLWLLTVLEDEYGMDESDYTVYLKKPKGENK